MRLAILALATSVLAFGCAAQPKASGATPQSFRSGCAARLEGAIREAAAKDPFFTAARVEVEQRQTTTCVPPDQEPEPKLPGYEPRPSGCEPPPPKSFTRLRVLLARTGFVALVYGPRSDGRPFAESGGWHRALDSAADCDMDGSCNDKYSERSSLRGHAMLHSPVSGGTKRRDLFLAIFERAADDCIAMASRR